jgi:hypothetical protein
MRYCCKKLKYEQEEGLSVIYLPPIRNYIIETKYGDLDIACVQEVGASKSYVNF